MSPAVLSCVIFALALGGNVLGALLRTTLPQHHLSKESQDVVRLGAGLVATIAALVLGLLIAAAKGSFDTQSGQVKQITADIILLDALLEQYGPDAQPIRVEMRSAIGPLADRLWHEKPAAATAPFADRLWHEKPAAATAPFAMNAKAEAVYIAIQALSPRNDLQRSLQARAAQISTDLAQTRLLLFVESDSAIPAPFIAILAFWLIIIFASFSLFAALNVTLFSFLSLFALSASCAIFLILELSEPFTGLLMIPSAPLRNACTARLARERFIST